MAPPVIDFRHADDPRDVVHRAVQALAEGKLVAFPTETVYGLAASALSESAVARLSQLKERPDDQPLTLAVKSAEDALDYVPALSSVAARLARRCWPGPITIVLKDDHPDSLVKQLPALSRAAVSAQGTIGLRVPAHQLLLAVLRLTAGPIVLTSANRPGQTEPTTAQEVVQAFGDDVDLVIDDGPAKFGQPSTVVQVEGNQLTILRPGVINDATLKRLTSMMVLFVCTGNTCRSPMAELLMQKRVADRLQCDVRELEDRGFMIMSAGVAAMMGGQASNEAVEVLKEMNLDLSQHESQPLGDRLVRFADHIFTMTRGHREAILSQWPDAEPRIRLICRDNCDVSDPIGGPLEFYRRCAAQIDEQLAGWMSEFDFTAIPDPIETGDQGNPGNPGEPGE